MVRNSSRVTWPAARLLKRRVRIMSFDQTAGTAHALLARASPKRRDGPEEEGPLLERHRRGGEARRWRHELLPGACPPGAGRLKFFADPTQATRFLAHASRSGLPTRAPHVRDRDPTRPHTHARRPHHPETCGFRGSPVRVARLLRPRTRGEREGFAARMHARKSTSSF